MSRVRRSSRSERRRRTPGSKFAGGHRIRVTPVPIPNTEVKPDTADGTAWETVWESRSLPALFRQKSPTWKRVGLFLLVIRDWGLGIGDGWWQTWESLTIRSTAGSQPAMNA